MRGSLPVQRGSGQVQVKRITPQVGWTALGGGKLFAGSSLSIWAQCLERKGKTKGDVCVHKHSNNLKVIVHPKNLYDFLSTAEQNQLF